MSKYKIKGYVQKNCNGIGFNWATFTQDQSKSGQCGWCPAEKECTRYKPDCIGCASTLLEAKPLTNLCCK